MSSKSPNVIPMIQANGVNQVPVCRICQTGNKNDDAFITPCNCRGIFAYGHSSCLSNWVEATNLAFCDVCRFEYIADKRSKSFTDWRRLEGKTLEYQSSCQDCWFSLYNLIIAAILLMATYGNNTCLTAIVISSSHFFSFICLFSLVMEFAYFVIDSCPSCFHVVLLLFPFSLMLPSRFTGSVIPLASFILAGCTLFWFIFLTGSFLIYSWRELTAYKEWTRTHFKYTVKGNPNHGKFNEAVPPRNFMRTIGLQRAVDNKSTPHSLPSSSSLSLPLWKK